MDSLQYYMFEAQLQSVYFKLSFKPCYKWIAFNTYNRKFLQVEVFCFKPCYKWIAFNTLDLNKNIDFMAF